MFKLLYNMFILTQGTILQKMFIEFQGLRKFSITTFWCTISQLTTTVPYFSIYPGLLIANRVLCTVPTRIKSSSEKYLKCIFYSIYVRSDQSSFIQKSVYINYAVNWCIYCRQRVPCHIRKLELSQKSLSCTENMCTVAANSTWKLWCLTTSVISSWIYTFFDMSIK